MPQDTTERTSDTPEQTTGKSRKGGQERQERQVQREYKVRQVTSYQASWMELERGDEGLFTVQLILDHGVAEYTLELDSDDVEGLLKLLARSKYTSFDLERKVLMFSNIDAA